MSSNKSDSDPYISDNEIDIFSISNLNASITIVLYYLIVVLARGECNFVDLLDLLLDLYLFFQIISN